MEKKKPTTMFSCSFLYFVCDKTFSINYSCQGKNSYNVFSIRKNYNVCEFKKSIPYDLQINTYLTYFH